MRFLTLLPALAALGCAAHDQERTVALGEPSNLPTTCPSVIAGVDVDLNDTSDGYEIILATDRAEDIDDLERVGPRLFDDFARAYGYLDRYTLSVTRVLDDDDFEIDLPDLGLDMPAAPVDERLIPEGVQLTIVPRNPVDLDLVQELGHSFGDYLEDHCGAGV